MKQLKKIDSGHRQSIDEYTAQDRFAALECLSQLQDAEHAVESNRRTGMEVAKQYFDEIVKQVAENDGMIFIARYDGEVAGMMIVLVLTNDIIEVPGKHLYIADLVVKDVYRRRGIARNLMSKAEAYARQKGIPELRVTVLSGNAAALSVYRKANFEEQEVTLSKKIVGDL
jgi:ribosomal protein S18 acetylase RimI-like enzyme